MFTNSSTLSNNSRNERRKDIMKFPFTEIDVYVTQLENLLKVKQTQIHSKNRQLKEDLIDYNELNCLVREKKKLLKKHSGFELYKLLLNIRLLQKNLENDAIREYYNDSSINQHRKIDLILNIRSKLTRTHNTRDMKQLWGFD